MGYGCERHKRRQITTYEAVFLELPGLDLKAPGALRKSELPSLAGNVTAQDFPHAAIGQGSWTSQAPGPPIAQFSSRFASIQSCQSNHAIATGRSCLVSTFLFHTQTSFRSYDTHCYICRTRIICMPWSSCRGLRSSWDYIQYPGKHILIDLWYNILSQNRDSCYKPTTRYAGRISLSIGL